MANQAWQIASSGKLVLNDIGPLPVPKPNEVLIRIHAFSLNYRDTLIVDHNPAYPLIAKPNLIPGNDGAGVVEIAGSASGWEKGDRVIVMPSPWLFGNDARDFKVEESLGAGENDGLYRRFFLCDGEYLFRAPASMSLQEAATVWGAGLTAYRALAFGDPKLEPGISVLTQGTGGVSCYAIQIAAAAGATVIATSSSDAKLESARELGAKHVVNYRKTPDWSAKVLRYTDGVGVDIVADVVGGSELEHSINSVRFGGRIALMGILDKEDKPFAVTRPLLFGSKTIQPVLGPGSRELAIEFCKFIEEHQIHPPIAKMFAFEEADKALEALRSLQGVGKIVVEV